MRLPKGPFAAAQVPERLRPLVQQLTELNETDLALVLDALVANEVELDRAGHAALWKLWAESGPQGPIDDDGEPEFP